ncbi:ferredoxin--NADP reductase [Blastopirellula marina]|uniref:ferredoxin--NADP(+) reductase n=1 Tax=Blastopirellula marina TaxID=124 RepID=A0A2S8GHN6_9BACT|nr:ferredoxin--NADP reductase [Blastopirellula marina]PQO43947.1 ferredoxin--NADP reductase [Blastopirellula marina]
MFSPMASPMEAKRKPELVGKQAYNAKLVEIVSIHDSLRIFRIASDDGPISFLPGQYVGLGMGSWEPGDALETTTPDAHDHLIQRAYSISWPIFDKQGNLLRPRDPEVLEFYVALVVRSMPHPQTLTPRLFHLQVGDRLWMGEHARGTYTLKRADRSAHLVFVATGTGEAPHNAMIAELLATGHTGPITNLACVRYRQDLGYLRQHRELERQFANYRYLPLTTREPENLDPSLPQYVGKQYVQDVFQNWESMVGDDRPLDPKSTHVYLCGNPEMIGAPQSLRQQARAYPTPTGMAEILDQLGFQLDQPKLTGNIHLEKYW